MLTEYKFKTNSRAEHNDIYWPGDPTIFGPGRHNFMLFPKAKFWRFGVILSKNATIKRPSKSRYDFVNYQYIQIATGVIESSTDRKLETRLEVGNMQRNHPFFTFDDYEPESEIELGITYDPTTESIDVECSATGLEIKRHTINNVEQLTHFQVFAWADWTPFELEFSYKYFPKVVSGGRNNEAEYSPYTNITFINGDLFENRFKSEGYLIVQPVSSTGSVSPLVNQNSKLEGFPEPGLGEIGSVTIHDLNNSRSFKGAWAYSVEGDKGSSLGSISNILESLRTVDRKRGINTIVTPLLGTGAGKLDHFEVAKLFWDAWKLAPKQLKLIVCIKSKKEYHEVKAKIEALLSEEYVSATIPDLLARNEVEGVLGVKELAANLAGLLSRMPTDQDTMIGIFGKWGRGKTRLMDEVFTVLNGDNNAIRVDFHAWKYQDTPAAWAYLYEQFSDQYFEEYKSYWHKYWRKVRLNFNRLGKWVWVCLFFGVGVSIYLSFGVAFWTKVHFIFWLLGTLGLGGAVGLYFIFRKFGGTAKSLIKEYSKRVSFAHYVGVQAEIQKELRVLLQTWTKSRGSKGKRIYLFVDDIDRCSEENIIRVVDALRVMVEDPEISKHVVIIAAIDDRILKRAIEFKYKEIIGDQSEIKKEFENLTKEYFDKLFIIGVRLSDLNESEREEFFNAAVKKFRNEAVKVKTEDKALQPQMELINLTPKVAEESGNRESEGKQQNKERENDKSLASTASESEAPVVWISDDEYKMFKDCLSDSPVITPRQIKIVFYRYLLAKAILDSVYGAKRNIWRQTTNCGVLMTSLILKSFNEDFSHNSIRTLAANNEASSANGGDIDRLIAAVDLVVAY